MLWVCRTGVNSVFLDTFLNTNRIYLPWEGFKTDLRKYKDRERLKELVRAEKGDAAPTSISNWSGQLYSFCWEMQIGDLVLIPHKGSRSFTLVEIVGEYQYCPEDKNKLWHSRSFKIKKTDISKAVFSQSMRYSLGAYRTIFKVKDEKQCLASISALY